MTMTANGLAKLCNVESKLLRGIRELTFELRELRDQVEKAKVRAKEFAAIARKVRRRRNDGEK